MTERLMGGLTLTHWQCSDDMKCGPCLSSHIDVEMITFLRRRIAGAKSVWMGKLHSPCATANRSTRSCNVPLTYRVRIRMSHARILGLTMRVSPQVQLSIKTTGSFMGLRFGLGLPCSPGEGSQGLPCAQMCDLIGLPRLPSPGPHSRAHEVHTTHELLHFLRRELSVDKFGDR